MVKLATPIHIYHHFAVPTADYATATQLNVNPALGRKVYPIALRWK